MLVKKPRVPIPNNPVVLIALGKAIEASQGTSDANADLNDYLVYVDGIGPMTDVMQVKYSQYQTELSAAKQTRAEFDTLAEGMRDQIRKARDFIFAKNPLEPTIIGDYGFTMFTTTASSEAQGEGDDPPGVPVA